MRKRQFKKNALKEIKRQCMAWACNAFPSDADKTKRLKFYKTKLAASLFIQIFVKKNLAEQLFVGEA